MAEEEDSGGGMDMEELLYKMLIHLLKTILPKTLD